METMNGWKRGCLSGKFLPYLWGMETSMFAVAPSVTDSSYRTYEEWKPTYLVAYQLPQNKFLPYLWGMETL